MVVGMLRHLTTPRTTVDDQCSWCNRQVMSLTMCVFGVVVSLRHYTHTFISCTGFNKFDKDFVNDYCWSQGLYTIREAYDHPMSHVPYPGIMPEDLPPCVERELADGSRLVCPPASSFKPLTRVEHLWYQWVPFYFWLLAFLFHAPYILLKQLGFGDIKPVLALLHNNLESSEEMERSVDKACNWLFRHLDHSGHTNRLTLFWRRHKLGLVLVLMKCLYLVVSILTLVLTARMFPLGDFLTYGYHWSVPAIQNNDTQSTLVRDKLFPKMVSCKIKVWSASGLDQESGMCVLAPNVINQYLFLILWFLVVILIAINTFSLLLTLLTFPSTCTYHRFLLSSFIRDDNPRIRKLYGHIGTSGRIMLHVLRANVDVKVVEAVVVQLMERMFPSTTNVDPYTLETGRGRGKGDTRRRNLITYAANGGARAKTGVERVPSTSSSH